MKLNRLLLIALCSALPLSLQAAELPGAPHISTNGEASIKVEPNMVTIKIRVSATEERAADAKNKVDQQLAKYIEFLLKQGVSKEDIKAVNIITRPEYDYTDNKRVFIGYIAERNVNVALKQLDKLNSLLDAALAEGLNEILNIEFGVSNPENYQIQAREKAIEDAKSKANAVAKSFDANLGKIYSIRYFTSGQNESIPVMAKSSMTMDRLGGANIDETYGQQMVTFTDRVDVVFGLNP